MRHRDGGRRETRRRHRGRVLGAPELARLLLELAALGSRQRSLGRCLGAGLAQRVRIGPHGCVLEHSGASLRRERRAALHHARAGHDGGCEVFGVSHSELAEVAHAHDGAGAASYLLDGVAVAVDGLSDDQRKGECWEPSRALELLDIELRRRITPADALHSD